MAKILLHSAVFGKQVELIEFFLAEAWRHLDARLQGFSLACFPVDCAGFTDLKTDQLFYKPMTTVAGLDGLVLI